MSIAVVGVSHHTAPIEIRERFAFGDAAVPRALERALRRAEASEAVLLSTCNRTELYLRMHAGAEALAGAAELLAGQAGELPRPAQSFLYVHEDREAVRHLFRVASGLDSMVVGEAEIQGQVKQAYELARGVAGRWRPVGPVMNRMFQAALSVGGAVRAQTRIAEGAGSVPSAAVELARKIFGTLRGRRGMVVGTGEMAALTLRCLLAEGMENLAVVSREAGRAEGLAREMGGTALSHDALWERLSAVDIVIAATAAPHPVITLERFMRAAPDRSRSPLLIVDIAVPRDVEPEVGARPDVFLYTIDDLQGIVSVNYDRRRSEVPRAEEIVARAAAKFWRWYSGLEAVPLIRGLRKRGEEIRRHEIERSLSQLSHLSEDDRAEVERLSRNLMRKLLHSPTARLRAAAENGADARILEAARYLFDIDGERGEEGGGDDEGRS